MDDTDASALVHAALQHDDEAARALVQQLYPLVAKIVRSHRPHRTDEEDLCQMIFIKIFQKLSQFSGKVPLEHWVSRIAVNTCLNQIESERVRPELRHADLSDEEQAVVENLATSSDELAPDQRFASRQLVEHLLAALNPVAMPFGFDTRVVALWRASALRPNGLTPLLRRIALLSAAVIVVSTIATVREASQSRKIGESLTNEFAIADSAIQDEFSP